MVSKLSSAVQEKVHIKFQNHRFGPGHSNKDKTGLKEMTGLNKVIVEPWTSMVESGIGQNDTDFIPQRK